MRHVLVEDLAGYRSARRWLTQHPGPVRWHTASPLLLELLAAEGCDVVSVERSFTQPHLDALGGIAWQITRSWVNVLDACQASRAADLAFGQVVFPQLALFWCPLLLRAVTADRWLSDTAPGAADERSVVGEVALSPVRVDFVRIRPQDTLFAALLDGANSMPPVGRIPVDRVSEPADEYADDETPWRARVAARHVLPWMNISRSKIAYGLWRRVLGGCPAHWPGRPVTTEVFLFRANELIKESTLTLLRMGARLTALPLPGPAFRSGEAQSPDADVQRTLVDEAWRAMRDAGLDGPCVRAAAHLGAQRVAQWLAVFAPYARQAAAAVEASMAGPKRPVLLTNGLTDPLERLLDQLMQRRRIPVVAVDHSGCAGLTPIHGAVAEVSDLNACDRYAIYNECGRAFYASRLGSRMPPTLVVGAPEATRREGSPRLARAMARWLLGVGFRERVIVYVTNMFRGNGIILPHGHLDTHYHRIVTTIACDVLPLVPATCLVKLYPRHRGEDPSPLTRCAGRPLSIRLLREIDFRYIRAAADVVVVDVPYSTLGWALGADIPTVLLDLPFNPLLPDVADRVDAALFRVDASRSGWNEELLRLLTLPQHTLLEQWRAKASSRRSFLSDCLFGSADRQRERLASFVLEAGSVPTLPRRLQTERPNVTETRLDSRGLQGARAAAVGMRERQ